MFEGAIKGVHKNVTLFGIRDKNEMEHTVHCCWAYTAAVHTWIHYSLNWKSNYSKVY